MNAMESQVKRGRKFDQVVAGAREVFLRDGFEGASVDEIARVANVSKATLYSYFSDKRVLFIEVTKAECRQQADRALNIGSAPMPLRERLLEAARLLVTFVNSPFALRVFRVCVAESERFPDLGQEFYATGPQLARDRLEDVFRAACAREELSIADIDLAADQFAQLCKADLFSRRVFNLAGAPTKPEIERIATGAVDMFLARYGV